MVKRVTIIDRINDPEESLDIREGLLLTLAARIADTARVPVDCPNLSDETLEAMAGGGLYDVAGAVQVAIEYGDLSALEGCGFELQR